MSQIAIHDKNNTSFKSLPALQTAHSELLEIYSTSYHEELSEELKTKIKDFMNRAVAAGSILSLEEDRSDAQTYLNYWTAVLYNAGESPESFVLERFDKERAIQESGEISPYRGLQAFNKENRSDYFGPKKLIPIMMDLIRRERFLAVIGLSGSGKSSLVRAGLLPELESGAISGSENWEYLEPIFPGADPLLSLAKLIVPKNKDCEERLNEQKKSLTENENHLFTVLNATGKTVVITVDQFEELFTLATNEEEQQTFVGNLVNLVNNLESTHRLILTMRNEFDLSVARYPQLQELFERSQVRVTSLNAAELRKAIEKPAAQRGITIDEKLIGELTQSVLGEPAGLPLLQFTLQQLWKHRGGNRITLDDYEKLGGSPKKILSKVANKIYNSFKTVEDEDLSRHIFLSLVRPKAGLNEVTSSREKRMSLYSLARSRDRINRVLKVWEEAGLLRVTYVIPGENSDEDLIEITHEALIRNWDKLMNWVEEKRTKEFERLLLTPLAEQWNINKEKDPSAGGLLGGEALRKAKSYSDLNDLEKAFVKASEEAEIEAIRKETFRIRLAKAFLAGSLIFLLVTGFTMFYAVSESSRAASESNRAMSESNRANSETLKANTAINQLESKKEEFEKELKRLEKEELKAKTELKETKNIIGQLEEQRKTRIAQIKKWEDAVRTAQMEGKQAQADAQEAIALAKNAKKDIENKEKEIELKRNELEQLEERVNTVQANYKELENNYKILEARYSTAKAEQERAQANANAATIALNNAENKIEEKEKELEATKEVVEEIINPGILIQNGQFITDSKKWKEPLENHSSEIKKTAASVGKIEISNKSDRPVVNSTTFLIAEDIAIAPAYLFDQISGETKQKGIIRIDFRENPNSDKSHKFAVKRIMALDQNLGVALLQVERQTVGGDKLPHPLSITDKFDPKVGNKVYVIGYPQGDSRIPPELIKIAFKDQLGVKRLQPGNILSIAISNYFKVKEVIAHNCFTLPGNGGSPLVDLETGKVIGIHIGGQPAKEKNTGVKEGLPLTNSIIKQLLLQKKFSFEVM